MNRDFNLFTVEVLGLLFILFIEDWVGIATCISLEVCNNVAVFTRLFEQINEPIRKRIWLNF